MLMIRLVNRRVIQQLGLCAVEMDDVNNDKRFDIVVTK